MSVISRMQSVERRLERAAHRAGCIALRLSRVPHDLTTERLVWQTEFQTNDVEAALGRLEDHLTEQEKACGMEPIRKGGDACSDS
jgi:hypothetical protein